VPTPDFAALTDVTPAFRVSYGRTSFHQGTDTLYAGLTARHTGATAITGPVLLVVKNISDPLVRVQGFDGLTPAGQPYFDLTARFGGAVDTNEVSSAADLQFFNQPRRRFTYDLQFLAPANQPPAFVTAPRVEVPAGKAYRYPARAADPDPTDTLTYSLLAGPSGMTVDPASGTVTWAPTAADAGTHGIVLGVRDSRGATAEQQFVLSVTVGLPNRPPVFVTPPVVDANVGTEYVYPSQADDPDFDELTYSVADGPAGLAIDPRTGRVTWTPTAAQLGVSRVVLRADDGRGGVAEQPYDILVLPAKNNRPPVIVSSPQTKYDVPVAPGSPDGEVSPGLVRVTLPRGTTADRTVSVVVPQSKGTVDTVDVFLLLDDTGSFSGTGPLLTGQFPAVVDRLRQSFPTADFAFGVGRFEDFNAPEYEDAPEARPFVLNQPVVRAAEGGFQAALESALSRQAPGNGGDGPETLIESLYQVATGAGFDGDADGKTDGSGPAGPLLTQTSPGFSGDVPAFGTFTADPTNNVLPAAGTAGGAGFRPGSLRIVLAATDVGTAYTPEPAGTVTIAGAAGVTVPYDRFTHPVTSRGSTPGGRGASVQQAVNALVALGAQVVGLGPEGFRGLPPIGGGPPAEDPDTDPRRSLEALATLTGAVNRTGQPIDSLIPDDPIAPGEPLFFRIVPNSAASLADGVSAAITAAVLGSLKSVTVAADQTAAQVQNLTGPVSVLGGQTATFTVRLTGTGEAQSFNLLFTQEGTSGVRFGSLPVVIDYPYDSPVFAVDPDGDVVAYRLLDAPAGATIDSATGTITWQPTVAGSYPFRVEASDGRGGFDFQSYTVVVTQGSANAAPAFTSKAPTAGSVGRPFSYPAAATDPDGDKLSYYLLAGPGGMTLDRLTGLVSWAPGLPDLGDHPVRLEVIDGRATLTRGSPRRPCSRSAPGRRTCTRPRPATPTTTRSPSTCRSSRWAWASTGPPAASSGSRRRTSSAPSRCCCGCGTARAGWTSSRST
jgi:hypothetical protein